MDKQSKRRQDRDGIWPELRFWEARLRTGYLPKLPREAESMRRVRMPEEARFFGGEEERE